MQALRQAGSGLIIAIISVLLVLGGISLAIAETTLPQQSVPTQVAPTLPLFFPTPTGATAMPQIETSTETATLTIPPTTTSTPTPTALPAVCVPPSGWIAIIVSANDTIYTLAQRYNTTTDLISAGNCLLSINISVGSMLYVPPVIATATVIPCGPPVGWVKTHIVQPGDNLYRIALSYGLTYPQLQAANCMGSSVLIYAGQKLWVPNIPTLTPTPGTSIPDFITETPSATSVPPTATSIPPSATSTFMVTATVPTGSPTLTPFPSRTKTP